MSNIEAIMKMAKKNNGIITTNMVVTNGLPRASLKYLADKKMLERTNRGVYTLPEAWDDELVNLQSRFKRGVFSCETVLFLCDLTDRTPSRYCMTFPAAYNLTNPKKENIRCLQAKEPIYSTGIVNLQTPGGNMVKGYCMERTLCDILKTRNHTDIQIIADAYKRYSKRADRNIPLLSEYAKLLKVDKKVNSYLEVLL